MIRQALTSTLDTKVLVLIVAYEAEQHTVAVLERIPRRYFQNPLCQILFLDDSSGDRTAALAADWLESKQIENTRVLRNLKNQGYGGNQKIGYEYAIENNFDLVILLHGDGQYAPELLDRFVDSYEKEQADVILGSRLTSFRSAAQGGMPAYKIAGNKILTSIQNLITGKDLSEYHTGYRGYAVDFLRRIPFRHNTNGFHFDTQILLQAFYVHAKITEFPIPTHYGNEVCRVNGLRYALDVVMSTVQYRFHRLGMLCSLKYRNLDCSPYQDKTKVAYSSHAKALQLIGRLEPKRILDLGCGTGYVAGKCRELGARVVGLDRQQPLPGAVDEFLPWDLDERPTPVNLLDHDVILMLDIIEHLSDPEAFLLGLRHSAVSTNGTPEYPIVLLTTPNIAFLAIRLGLLLGRFSYAERGILDITHKRLFTRGSLLQMLNECGYSVRRIEGVGAPFATVIPGLLGRLLGRLSQTLASLWPTMFGFQFLVVAQPLPGLQQLLRSSERVRPTAQEE